MKNSVALINDEKLQTKIYTVRGKQVMLDRDLAELYQVKTKVLNQLVKRNQNRFPEDFKFQLTKEELENWRSQFVTSNLDKEKMGLRRRPYVFTESGVAMLAGVLKSQIAVKISVQIIQAFIQMRQLISNNALIFQRMDCLEKQQLITDSKVEQIFKAIEDKTIKPEKGIFFDGQVFDAYVFVSKLVKQAKKSIVLIDNYIDESVLVLLSKRSKNCKATIYAKDIAKKLALDLKKHNEQYPAVEIKVFKQAHDRFLILDDKEIYHIGASLKDLGKKWFGFSKLDKSSVLEILNRLDR